jgi:lactoylglutathione lyase
MAVHHFRGAGGIMKIQQTGFVLNVDKYEECVTFYSDIIGLPIVKQKDHLTNFRFGESYLLIEKGTTIPEELRRAENVPYVIRLNVADVDMAAERARTKGVEVNRFSADWGEIARLRDPDGNAVEYCKWK